MFKEETARDALEHINPYDKEIPQREKAEANLLNFYRAIKIKDINSCKQIEQGSYFFAFNLPCSLQVLNRKLSGQAGYMVGNQFGFNSALTVFSGSRNGRAKFGIIFFISNVVSGRM